MDKIKYTIIDKNGWYYNPDFSSAHFFLSGKSLCGSDALWSHFNNSYQELDERAWIQANKERRLCKRCVNNVEQISKQLKGKLI